MAQATVGALRVTLGANTAQYEAGMRRAQTQARATGQTISTSMTRAQATTQRAFAGIRQAAAGFGIGLATAGVAGFAAAAKAALDYAANLGETSQQIGVTVEQLQILSRIAIENGASQEVLETSLARLNLQLGQAKAGAEAALRPFQALGFTREQLNSFSQGGDILRTVAERIERIPDPARRAAAAKALMGRSAQELIPTLSAVAREYDSVASEAQRMGLLTAAQAQRADEASDKLAILANVLKTRLAIAVADNIGPIQRLIEGFAGLGTEAIRAAGAMQRAADRAMVASQGFFRAVRLALLGSGTINAAQFQRMEANAAGTVGQARTRLSNAGVIDALRSQINATPRVPRTDLGGDIDFDLSRSSRGGRGRDTAGEARRRREEALRNEAEFQSSLRRLRQDLLRAQQEQVTDAVARAQLDTQILDIEREQYIADQELAVQLGDLTDVRRQQLVLAYDAADEERRHTLELQQRREVDSENREIDQERRDIAQDALRFEADTADTAAERRTAELRLLDLIYRHERARLEEVLADETSSRAAVEKARLRIADLDNWRARETAGIQRSTMGPLESFLDQLPTTAEKANEALQRVAAEGLQSLEDGILSVLDGTKSLGEAFRDMASSIISDLLRIQIQRMITIPLANALGGGGGGGLGSVLSFLGMAAGGVKSAGGGAAFLNGLPLLPPGFASGGTIRIGGRGGIDRNLLSLNGQPIARVSQGEDLNISPPGRGGNIFHISVTAPNTGDPRRDRQTGYQQAVMVRDAVARAAKTGH